MSRAVVKLGSSIVADERGVLRADALERICGAVADFHAAGNEIVVVTSGAIARGIEVMDLPVRPTAIEEL
jgi:glutamate 5-kinase